MEEFECIRRIFIEVFELQMLSTVLCLAPLLWKEVASRQNPRYVHLHSDDSNDSLGSNFDSTTDLTVDTSQLPVRVKHRNSRD